jgi:hypothetical protein
VLIVCIACSNRFNDTFNTSQRAFSITFNTSHRAFFYNTF